MPPTIDTSKLLKKTYKISAKLEVFYTGGPVAVPSSRNLAICPCVDHVQVVDLENSSVVKSFSGDSEPVTAVTVSPDGKRIFGSSRSLQTRYWNSESGECHRSWKVLIQEIHCNLNSHLWFVISL